MRHLRVLKPGQPGQLGAGHGRAIPQDDPRNLLFSRWCWRMCGSSRADRTGRRVQSPQQTESLSVREFLWERFCLEAGIHGRHDKNPMTSYYFSPATVGQGGAYGLPTGCKFPLCTIYVTLGLGRVSQTKTGEFPGRAVIQINFFKKDKNMDSCSSTPGIWKDAPKISDTSNRSISWKRPNKHSCSNSRTVSCNKWLTCGAQTRDNPGPYCN